MAGTYRSTLPRRTLNLLMKALLRLGLAPRRYYLLSVRGRTSGRLHSTPIIVLAHQGQQWLVAPYGERAWVKNARAAGQVILRRGRRSKVVALEEERGPAQSAAVLKRYITEVPITRKFFDVTPQSPLEDFAAEAPRHPVFRIPGPAQ